MDRGLDEAMPGMKDPEPAGHDGRYADQARQPAKQNRVPRRLGRRLRGAPLCQVMSGGPQKPPGQKQGNIRGEDLGPVRWEVLREDPVDLVRLRRHINDERSEDRHGEGNAYGVECRKELSRELQ